MKNKIIKALIAAAAEIITVIILESLKNKDKKK